MQFLIILNDFHSFLIPQLEDDDANSESQCNFLKRSAFNQYFAISQEMSAFEKDLFERFMHEGTFVVNNVLKRNILKLKFMSIPEELKDELMRESAPQTMALARAQKASRGRQKTAAQRSSQSVLSSFVPRKSLSSKSKFNIFSTAIQWMASRPVNDNPDLVLAEKLMKASESMSNVKSLRSAARTEFKISQAKCVFERRNGIFSRGGNFEILSDFFF